MPHPPNPPVGFTPAGDLVGASAAAKAGGFRFILVLDSWMEGGIPPVVRERVRNNTKKKRIEAFPLERNGVPTGSVRSEGGYPIPGILQSVRKRLISKEMEEILV
jgi:hypothetical protein